MSKLTPEDRINRADAVKAMLLSPGGVFLEDYLKDREKDIVSSMLGEDCRKSKAYEVFAGRANEILDLRYRIKWWAEDGERAKQELVKLNQKGASNA